MYSRRNVVKNLFGATTAFAMAPALACFGNSQVKKSNQLKGNINHSVCRWTFAQFPLEQLCLSIKEIGFAAIDLVGPADWPVLQKHGIYSSMCNGAEINLVDGFNDTRFHETLVKKYTEMIPLVAKNGYTNLICFSGNRRGMDDETGLKNCVSGLQKIIPIAEKNGVVLHMELLNSKVDHKDYMCDKTTWGVELCKRLQSPNFKLLYDIYHMQIDEGDVIRTITNNHQYIGHYHTAGVPGRHEIDDTQELFYPAIIKAIKNTGFKGYVAQEFMPTAQEPLQSLKTAITLCDI